MKMRLTTNEAAEFLGFSRHTLNNSRTTGMLAGVTAPPHLKMGKTIRYDREALEAWLAQFESSTSTSQHAA